MRRWQRLLLGSSLALASAMACKHEGADTTAAPERRASEGKRREAKPPASMPRPYALPAAPQFAAHVAAPAPALVALGQSTGLGADPRVVLRTLLNEAGLPFEASLVQSFDLARPWSAALVEGQLIVQVPIERARLAEVGAMLGNRPKVGKFGAVDLQRAATTPAGAPAGLTIVPPKLAWLDPANAVLALANDERGIATARELAHDYGKHGVFATIDGAEIRKAVPSFPFTRVVAQGESVGDFRVSAEGGGQIEGLSEITEGALTGLLSSPAIVAGASSRYAKYQTVVKDLISTATREVNKQNFLVKGVLEDMLKRYNAVLRSWNGRVLVGLGPRNHIVLALGADDPARASNSVISLIDAVMGNLDLARTFGVSVPKLRFKRNRSAAAGVNVHVLAVDNARKLLPPEFASLIDEQGALRIAFAGSPHAGAIAVAVGPTAAESLADWLEQTKGATPGNKSTDHLLAATIAVGGDSFAQLERVQSLAPLLGLQAERAPTQAVVTRKGAAFDVHVTGPVPRPAATRGPTAARPPRTAGR